MSQQTQLAAQLSALREKINQGQIFQSLGTEIGKLATSVKKVKSTKVYLPRDDDEVLALIKQLRQKHTDNQLTEISDQDLLLLLGHIGSPDPEVRDHGVYFMFNELLEAQIFSKRQLTLAYKYLLSDEVLFDHILEPQNNAIYQRSFAVLLLSTLTYGDQAGYFFLTPELINQAVMQLSLYTITETDTRGFIRKNGWGHAYTHIGNVLDELSQRDELSRADKLFLMTVLIERYKYLQTPLIFGEPQRIASYLARITNKNELYQNYFLLQLKAWRSQLMNQFEPHSEGEWNRLMNHTRLMQAILVRGDFNEEIIKYIASGQQYLG